MDREAEEFLQMAEVLNKLLTLSILRFANNAELHAGAATFASKMLDAYMKEGFTREEAMVLVSNFMRSTSQSQSK